MGKILSEQDEELWLRVLATNTAAYMLPKTDKGALAEAAKVRHAAHQLLLHMQDDGPDAVGVLIHHKVPGIKRVNRNLQEATTKITFSGGEGPMPQVTKVDAKI